MFFLSCMKIISITTSFVQRFVSVIASILITFVTLYTYGQSGELNGRIRDTVLHKNCYLAVVMLLNSDSTLLQFTRSRKDGSFFFQRLLADNYLLMITHPSYSDYSQVLKIQGNRIVDLGMVDLLPQIDTLEPVIVMPRNPTIRMKGDTLEYNTANMKLKENATVEELLRRLPGVDIDQNGGISINGQKIERLLVDGEDFFGGDPTIVTRIFNADMIAKVQILNKKSSQSEFTGINDGQKSKTLNLSLKDNSKQGYFVKAEAGGDPGGYYNCNGLLGSFKGRQQFAALGMASNNGTTGFDGAIGDMGSRISLGGNTGDALGASAGVGIPQVETGAIHYADKWNGSEDHVVGNYQYGRLITHPTSTSLTEQILPDSIYVQNQKIFSMNNIDKHIFSIDYDLVPDTISAFRLSLAGMTMNGNNQFSSSGSSYFNDTLVNNSFRAIQSQVRNQDFRSNFMWRIRNRNKAGRTFSVLAGVAGENYTTKGYLYSTNNFYHSTGVLLNSDTIDVRKVIKDTRLLVNGSLNYEETLWKDAMLGISYELSYNRGQSEISTYNKGDAKYQDYVDSLSNHYQNDILTQRTMLNLQGSNRKYSYTIGGDIVHYTYRQMDLIKDSLLNYKYLNFSPRVNVLYNLTDDKGFAFEYNGFTQQPSITELEPIQNNNDALHVVLGNPDLHSSFSHNFGIGFHDFKHKTLDLRLNFGFTTNSISTKTFTDILGRQISQAVNTNGSRNGELNITYGKKMKPTNLDIGITANLFWSRSSNYVNTLLSQNDNYNVSGGFKIGKNVPNKYDFQVNTNFIYSYSSSSVNLSAETRYWTQNHSVRLSIFPSVGLELNTSAYFTWRQKTSVFDQNNATALWNAFVSKSLLSSRLNLRWQINDILGQNVGINRNASANQISENNFNIIGRYWLVSATYRFIHHRKEN